MNQNNPPEGGIVACLDVGSNATRLRIFEVRTGLMPRELHRKRYPVQLGAGTFADGRLRDAEMHALEIAVRDAAEIAAKWNAHQIHAVATSATREASNGREFIDRLRKNTGMAIRIIDGAEEARLVAAGAVGDPRNLPGRSGPGGAAAAWVIDIGGGSTEIVQLSPGATLRAFTSIHLGAVRLVRQWNIPATCTAFQTREFVEKVKDFARRQLPPEMTESPGGTGTNSEMPESIAWALGGTPGALMRIRSAITAAQKKPAGDTAHHLNPSAAAASRLDPSADFVRRPDPSANTADLQGSPADPAHHPDRQAQVSLQELTQMLNLVAESGPDTLVRHYGLDPNRAGLILSGAIILTALTELLAITTIFPTDRGLCEGLAQMH